METTKHKPGQWKIYACLVVALFASFLSVTFFLGRGFSSPRFITGVSWGDTFFPIALVFPLYSVLDFIDDVFFPKYAQSYLPLDGEKRKTTTNISFFVGVFSIAVCVIAYVALVNTSDAPEVQCLSFYLVAPNVAMLGMLLPTAIYARREGRTRDFVIACAIIALAFGITIYMISGLQKGEATYGLGLLYYPLSAIFLLFYNRKD